MENASKALIIAGSVLIMILVLSLATYTFTRMGRDTAKMYSELEASDKSEFNQRFLNYKDRDIKKDASGQWINALSIQDIVTVVNFAKENNKSRRMPVQVKVTLTGTGDITNYTDSQLNNLLTNNVEKKYECTGVHWNNELGLIDGITFKNKT